MRHEASVYVVNMNDPILSRFYTNSGDEIHPGDKVILDGRVGVIELVCLPNSTIAASYACRDSGGLLIMFDDGILELIPFGFFHQIWKNFE